MENLENYNDLFCCYCRDPIVMKNNSEREDYVYKAGKYYHLECFNQIEVFIDDEEFDD